MTVSHILPHIPFSTEIQQDKSHPEIKKGNLINSRTYCGDFFVTYLFGDWVGEGRGEEAHRTYIQGF